MRAFVYRSGVIGFGMQLPELNVALPLAKAPKKILQAAVWGTARKAYRPGIWLVPGVPEADDDSAAVDAVLAYKKRLQRSIDCRRRNVGGRAVTGAA